jgi:hypothetical protein
MIIIVIILYIEYLDSDDVCVPPLIVCLPALSKIILKRIVENGNCETNKVW